MDEEAFVWSILESPGDHSLRLAYADWLEERGDPRGEFLRVVHEMGQIPVCSARYRKLRLRRDAMRKHFDSEWLKHMQRATFPEIRSKLEELDRLDPTRSVFGSSSHQYRLSSPLSVERVEQIEARIGCRLPEQYRRFVTEFADGGAGPDYGIEPLESLIATIENPDELATLANPFAVPANVEEMRELDSSAGGALPICQIGCGGYYQLILSGPDSGYVWIVNPDGDWSPALLDESHFPSGSDVDIDAILEAAIRSPQALKLEFVDWFLKWLDDSLWKVSCSSTAEDEVFDLDPETSDVSVAGRKLTVLPNNLRQLTALRSLNLHGDELAELPDWIGDFTNLERLGIGGNPLRSLPDSIGNLIRLKRLYCSNTEVLEQLPDTIGHLVGLECLRLSFNQLKTVPESIGNLKSLRELDLCHNQLTELPATIGGLQELRELKLTWNKISQLPSALTNLLQLRELDLRANAFRELPGGIDQLSSLRTINLGENPELDVADTCRKLARVPTLRHLSLFMNKLTKLPDEIGLLTQLNSLDLSWNQLTTLPASLTRLTHLEELCLDHNPELTKLRDQRRILLPQLT